MAEEETDRLRREPCHPVGHRGRLRCVGVADLELPTGPAPTRVVAPALGREGPRARFDDAQLLIVGRLQQPPQAHRAARVAAVGRVPRDPVDERSPLGVCVEREAEVRLGEHHVAGALVDDTGDEVSRHALGRCAGDLDQPHREVARGRDVVGVGVVAVDQLVQDAPEDLVVEEPWQRGAHIVVGRIRIVGELQDVEHLAHPFVVVVEPVVHAREPPQDLLFVPHARVVPEEPAPHLEPSAFAQLGQRRTRPIEGRRLVDERGIHELLAEQRQARLVDLRVVQGAQAGDERFVGRGLRRQARDANDAVVDAHREQVVDREIGEPPLWSEPADVPEVQREHLDVVAVDGRQHVAPREAREVGTDPREDSAFHLGFVHAMCEHDALREHGCVHETIRGENVERAVVDLAIHHRIEEILGELVVAGAAEPVEDLVAHALDRNALLARDDRLQQAQALQHVLPAQTTSARTRPTSCITANASCSMTSARSSPSARRRWTVGHASGGSSRSTCRAATARIAGPVRVNSSVPISSRSKKARISPSSSTSNPGSSAPKRNCARSAFTGTTYVSPRRRGRGA